MIRLLGLLIAVLSTTILLAEAVVVGYLWSQGQFSGEKLAGYRQVFSGETDSEQTKKDKESASSAPSQQEMQMARIMRVLDLESQAKELELLKTMTLSTEKRLISERQTFDEIKAAFREELAELSQRHQQEAVEQARAVLMAAATEFAVERLMSLPLPESVDLVRGMPEKSIAKILQGFAEPAMTPERAQRGQQIFEALSRGEPVRQAITKAQRQIPEGTAEPSPGGG